MITDSTAPINNPRSKLGDIKIKVEIKNLDEIIEKAIRLNLLLEETKKIISSLSEFDVAVNTEVISEP